MAAQVNDVRCSGCDAPADIGLTKCKFCKSPVLVTTFNSVYSMPMPMVNQYASASKEGLKSNPDNKDLNNSLAICYLKLKLYDKALTAFEKAIEEDFDNPETYFLAAMCVLGGKKAFLAQRPAIDKIEEYINAALAIEPRGIFYYFWAYIKYDYFDRKFFNTSPTYRELLADAEAAGLSPLDVEQLYGCLGVARPDVL